VNDSEYTKQIAERAGLQYYPGKGPWGRKSGCAIGVRDGYVTTIGVSHVGNQRFVAILLHFKKTQHPEMLKGAVTGFPGVAQRKQGKFAESGPDFLRWSWAYSLSKPKPEEVAGLADALREALKQNTEGFDGKCAKCGSTSTPGLTLQNGMPTYICASCQQQAQSELDQAAINYAAMTPNYPNGLVLGILAAALGGVAWGFVAYWLDRIFLWGAILIGFGVAWAVVKGTKKVNLFVQVVIPILTVASVVFGDALFFTLKVMKMEGVPFTQKLFGLVIANLWDIEVKSSGVFSAIFALAGAVAAVYKARRPKFKVMFEPLGSGGA